MSHEQLLYQSPLMYRLLRQEDGKLVLEVVVGTIAMDEVRVRLTPEEEQAYAREGTAFTDRMAREIMSQPSYGGRSY